MKKTILFLLLTSLLCALSSCGKALRKTIYAMDTAAVITVYGGSGDDISAAEREIYRLDALFSRSNKNSDVCRLNETKDADISPETESVINTALDISRLTNGAFDITVAPLTDTWGFFNQRYRVPSAEEINLALKKTGYENIVSENAHAVLKNDAEIDLGGIGKGYAADRAADILIKSGVKSALISFGSTIRAVGKKSAHENFTIGIANPKNTDEYIARLEITDACVSTSGSYERAFEENGKRYHHIIDPASGCPADAGLSSVSVICAGSARADALSTALFVMGLDRAKDFLRENSGIEAVFITDDNTVFFTSGLKNSLSVTDGFSSSIID